VGAYLVHEVGEALDLIEQGRVLQVLENPLAVVHGVGIAQVAVENGGDEVTLPAITRDRRRRLLEQQAERPGHVPARSSKHMT
jgi:hypothetical protein